MWYKLKLVHSALFVCLFCSHNAKANINDNTSLFTMQNKQYFASLNYTKIHSMSNIQYKAHDTDELNFSLKSDGGFNGEFGFLVNDHSYLSMSVGQLKYKMNQSIIESDDYHLNTCDGEIILKGTVDVNARLKSYPLMLNYYYSFNNLNIGHIKPYVVLSLGLVNHKGHYKAKSKMFEAETLKIDDHNQGDSYYIPHVTEESKISKTTLGFEVGAGFKVPLENSLNLNFGVKYFNHGKFKSKLGVKPESYADPVPSYLKYKMRGLLFNVGLSIDLHPNENTTTTKSFVDKDNHKQQQKYYAKLTAADVKLKALKSFDDAEDVEENNEIGQNKSSLKHRNGKNFGVEIGYNFSNRLSAGIAFSHMNNKFSSSKNTDFRILDEDIEELKEWRGYFRMNISHKLKIRTSTLLANINYTPIVFGNIKFNTILEAGIARHSTSKYTMNDLALFAKIKDIDGNPIDSVCPNPNDTYCNTITTKSGAKNFAFAWSVGVGTEIMLSEKISLELLFKYFNYGNAKSAKKPYENNYGEVIGESTATKHKIRGKMFGVALKYKF